MGMGDGGDCRLGKMSVVVVAEVEGGDAVAMLLWSGVTKVSWSNTDLQV